MKKLYSAPQCITSVIEQEDILTTSPIRNVEHREGSSSKGTFFSYSDFGGAQ